MDGRFGGDAILRWQGAGTDEDDRRHPGPVACSPTPLLLQPTGSGSRSESAGLAISDEELAQQALEAAPTSQREASTDQ